MKYMLLIHQGATPTPGSDEWESLSDDGKTLTTDGPFVEIKEAVGGCNQRARALPRARRSRFRRLQRRLRARTVIEVLATRPGAIGKYTRFRIRRVPLSTRGKRRYPPPLRLSTATTIPT